jgi:nuclease-like protein
MKYIVKVAAMSLAIIFALPYTSFAGEWRYSKVGNAWWYAYDDGTWATSKWQKIGEKWYYFSYDGYMVTDEWVGNYYVGKDGAMLENAYAPDGTRVGPNGKKVTAKQ